MTTFTKGQRIRFIGFTREGYDEHPNWSMLTPGMLGTIEESENGFDPDGTQRLFVVMDDVPCPVDYATNGTVGPILAALGFGLPSGWPLLGDEVEAVDESVASATA